MKNIKPKESKHHISKPLQLNSVPQSENKSDSVLVCGADKIVKHIPRSEFSSSTPNLMQVLTAGNIVIDNEMQFNSQDPTFFSLFNSGQTTFHNGDDTVNRVSAEGMNMTGFDNTSLKHYLTVQPHKFTHSYSNVFDYFRFPAKGGGDWTFATTADIVPQTLQETLNNGNILNSSSWIAFPRLSIFNGNITLNSAPYTNQMDLTGNITENTEDGSKFETNSDRIKLVNSIEPGGLIFSPTYGGAGTTYTNAISPVNGGGIKQVIPVSVNSITPDPTTGNVDLPINLQTVINNQNRATGEFTIDSQDSTSSTRFTGGSVLFDNTGNQGWISASGLKQSYDDEMLYISNGAIKFDWDNGNKSLQLNLRSLQSGFTNVKFPYKPSGNYSLMYSEDLATYNPTTINLSLTELDTSYPDAIPGFRVHCNSISSGALIYEKTSAGWLQSAASIV